MAFSSGTTLKQTDQRQAAALASTGGGGGGGSTAVYEIGSFVPGNVTNGRIMLRHILEHDLEVARIRINAESNASNDVKFDLTNNGGTPFKTVKVSSGTQTASATLSEVIPSGNVLKVVCQDDDAGLTDTSLTFDAIRA